MQFGHSITVHKLAKCRVCLHGEDALEPAFARRMKFRPGFLTSFAPNESVPACDKTRRKDFSTFLHQTHPEKQQVWTSRR